MKSVKWWMRIVGSMYLFLFIAASFLKLPIRAEGPEGLLTLASAGDPIAMFVVDTWVTLGIWFGVLGIALFIASRIPEQAKVLVWTVIGWEMGGILIDIYKLIRGYNPSTPITWIVIHSVIIITGIFILRRTQSSFSKIVAG